MDKKDEKNIPIKRNIIIGVCVGIAIGCELELQQTHLSWVQF